MTQSQYFFIKSHSIDEPSQEDWLRICEELRAIGFETPSEILMRDPLLLFPLGYSAKQRVRELKQLGFQQPLNMIKALPALLRYNLKLVIESKIETLKAWGFKDPIKMMEAYPLLFGFQVERSMRAKIKLLSSLGFQNPRHVIEEVPSIWEMNKQIIETRINALKKNGFKDPISLIEAYPPLLSLRPSKNIGLQRHIIAKLEALKEMGFAKPIEMAKAFPELLRLNLEDNIKPTIQFLTLALGYTKEDIQNRPYLLGTSLPRMERLRQTLRRRGFRLRSLPLTHRSFVIGHFSEEDVLEKLERQGYFTRRQQELALADSNNWEWIFGVASSCSDILTQSARNPADSTSPESTE